MCEHLLNQTQMTTIFLVPVQHLGLGNIMTSFFGMIIGVFLGLCWFIMQTNDWHVFLTFIFVLGCFCVR